MFKKAKLVGNTATEEGVNFLITLHTKAVAKTGNKTG